LRAALTSVVVTAALGLYALESPAQFVPGMVGGLSVAGRFAAVSVPTPDHWWNPGATLSSDDQAGSLDGTVSGAATVSTNGWEFGTHDSKYVVLDGPVSNGTAYTVSVWVRPDKTAMDANESGGWVINDRGVGEGMDWQLIYWNNSESWRWGVFDTASVLTTVPHYSVHSSNVTHDAWQHVVGISTVTGITLYVDGVLEAHAALTNQPSDAATIDAAIGGAAWSPASGGTKYHGDVDDVRIWRRALDGATVGALHERGRGK
jgi:hypothetical protein